MVTPNEMVQTSGLASTSDDAMSCKRRCARKSCGMSRFLARSSHAIHVKADSFAYHVFTLSYLAHTLLVHKFASRPFTSITDALGPGHSNVS